MNKTLKSIQIKILDIKNNISGAVNNHNGPLSIPHGNFGIPGITVDDLKNDLDEILLLIENIIEDEDLQYESHFNHYLKSLDFLRSDTINNLWGRPEAYSAFSITINSLRKLLINASPKDDQKLISAKIKSERARLRALESSLNSLYEKSGDLNTKISLINDAHDAANRLPTELESLNEAKILIDEIRNKSVTSEKTINENLVFSENSKETISVILANAEDVLKRCETAYSASTSVGLAAAFNERSDELKKSIRYWVLALTSALISGGILGFIQIQEFNNLVRSDALESVIVINFILSILSVGAPVWFAWLATKQIGQRFKLSEDYAFKASVSRAYEGFRREAENINPELSEKLLASALSRFDELPLRLVDTETHGSPWHELASSDLLKEAVKTVPNFAHEMLSLAQKGIEAQKKSKSKNPKNEESTENP